jgi:hypothetical protein
MLSISACTDINEWMNKVVAIEDGGSILIGTYDGYGRVNDHEINYEGKFTCWHQACWEKAGKPTNTDTPSDYAVDQGWFFDNGAHDMEEPK